MFKLYRLLSPETAQGLYERLQDAEWGEGQARAVTGTVKRNEEAFSPADSQTVQDSVNACDRLIVDTLLCTITPPKFNRYSEGMEYGRHFDASPMGEVRTDYSFTLMLSPPDAYDGGDLCIEANGMTLTVPRPAPGVCIAYPCGAAHWVSPVTRGARIASIFWGQSMIGDPAQRALVTGLREVLRNTEDTGSMEAFSTDHTTLTGIHAALLRMWADA